MKQGSFLALLGLVVVGVWSRWIPHPPNMTAVNAVILLSAFRLGSPIYAFLTACVTMAVSDFVLGSHTTMPFVYLSFVLTGLLGSMMKDRRRLACYTAASSLLFFVLTNFGTWLTGGFYPSTFGGCVSCYVAALPFLWNQLVGDLFYTLVIFGGLEAIEKYISAILIEPLDRNDQSC